MNNGTFVLVDHLHDWSNLRPLTFTKPISQLRIGVLKLYEKWELLLGAKVEIKPVQNYLASFNTFSQKEDSTFINASIIPDKNLVKKIIELSGGESLYANGIFIASKTGKSSFETEINYSEEFLKISFPWDIFSLNEKAIALDFKQLTKNRSSGNLSNTNTVIGELSNIFLEKGAKVEAAILNTNDGYIYIGKDAEIMEGSLVRGSLALCENATLKLATKIYGATTVGPHSKVGGEVNNSVIQGYSNKGHDGFLGNSVIGEWCNLGADTNNSNLKNNYGEVTSWNYEKNDYIKTGLQFLGLIMGDHSKCGINTMFNTGTVVGVFANIFGGDFPPKHIPSFSWGGSNGFQTYQFDKAIDVAKSVMKRRAIELSTQDSDILNYLFKEETNK
tara:strand:+ start:1962 stop:3128 length:1167 start_codon:yes stop_codon:yes gene_type:complete